MRWSKGDAAAAAKVLSDKARELRGPLAFKGGLLSGSLLDAGQVEAIAKLPSRDVLNAQLVGTIAAPLSGLARTLGALIQGIAVQLGQIRDKGLVTGTASAAPADASSANNDELASDAPAAEAEGQTADLAEAGESATEATEPDAAQAEASAAEPETEAAEAAGVSDADSSSAEETPGDAAA